MFDFLGAIKSLGKIVDFVKWGLKGIGYGIGKFWKARKIKKIEKQKDKIKDADDPKDYTDLLNS